MKCNILLFYNAEIFQATIYKNLLQTWMHFPSKFCFTLSLIMHNLFVTYIHWNTIQNFLIKNTVKHDIQRMKERKLGNVNWLYNCKQLWSMDMRNTTTRGTGSTAALSTNYCRKRSFIKCSLDNEAKVERRNCSMRRQVSPMPMVVSSSSGGGTWIVILAGGWSGWVRDLALKTMDIYV